MYNYLEAMREDVNLAIKENYTVEELEELAEANTLYEISDSLWFDDRVTGNGSGSYTFNRAQAREYVTENMALAVKSFKEFGDIEKLADYLDDGDWEWIDVTIRCYLLDAAINEYLLDLGICC